MFRQYWRIKRRYPDAVLLFRVGDFYETFFDDAELVSKVLNITLTSRHGAPLAGFPHHAATPYIQRLVASGHKVAICEQVEDPSRARGLVRREVVRVITPGTVVEEELLSPEMQSILCAVHAGERVGIAFFDASTGDLEVLEVGDEEGLRSALLRYSPSEILVDGSSRDLVTSAMKGELSAPVEEVNAPADPIGAFRELTGREPESYGLGELPDALTAAVMALEYVRRTNMEVSLQGVRVAFGGRFMYLDGTTLRNLEIFRNLRGGKEGSLLSVIDHTVTPMGARTLREHLRLPLMDLREIEERLQAVQELFDNEILRDELRRVLRSMRDIERGAMRAVYRRASHQTLLGLRDSLRELGRLRELLGRTRSALLRRCAEDLPDLGELENLLTRALEDDPDRVAAGRKIKEGFDPELDELRKARDSGRRWLLELERKEKIRTGIGSLRIGYNRVLGYYIEIPKRYAYRVPRDYERKQSLKEVERFSNPELRRLEYKILGAQERLERREEEVFDGVVSEVASRVSELKEAARIVGLLDVLASHAEVATLYGYSRPELHGGIEIEILEGRHPVLERTLEEPFIPNDLRMNEDNLIIILTGPNMAGKSTFMRQVALIILLAQIGSFVPARRARIGLVDRIYTRVGATDDLWKGRSTFMVEMLELATILNTATKRSLILLDEIGRGTSTFDGLSIAWATVEYIRERIGARTIFATHYHQLTELEGLLPGVRNLHVEVARRGGKLLFLRKVLPGGMRESFGIEIASMAGVPERVVQRAKELLAWLEGRERSKPPPEEDPLRAEIASLDPDRMTPIEALQAIARLKSLLSEELDRR